MDAQTYALIGTIIGVLGGPLAYLIQQARADRKDTWRQMREVQGWAQSLVENYLHSNTQAMQSTANGLNRVADVLGGCEAAQLARRERQQQGRIPPIPAIAPKMTGD